jgi:hypothetical protein
MGYPVCGRLYCLRQGGCTPGSLNNYTWLIINKLLRLSIPYANYRKTYPWIPGQLPWMDIVWRLVRLRDTLNKIKCSTGLRDGYARSMVLYDWLNLYLRWIKAMGRMICSRDTLHGRQLYVCMSEALLWVSGVIQLRGETVTLNNDGDTADFPMNYSEWVLSIRLNIPSNTLNGWYSTSVFLRHYAPLSS